jgi:hypothetical protein
MDNNSYFTSNPRYICQNICIVHIGTYYARRVNVCRDCQISQCDHVVTSRVMHELIGGTTNQ